MAADRVPRRVVALGEVPNCPAVYAMHDGSPGARSVSYVGQAGRLRTRLRQHLVQRDSSVTTGAALVSLNPDLVRTVEWWTYDRLGDREIREAAELVAFDVLDPVLRSRGRPTTRAMELYNDRQFREEWQEMFAGPASGTLTIDTLPGLAVRLRALEARVESLEEQLSMATGKARVPPEDS